LKLAQTVAGTAAAPRVMPAPPYRSFTITGPTSRRAAISTRESAAAIRAKFRFRRPAMRREAGECENFFIAKYRDSESAQCVFGRRGSDSALSTAQHSLQVEIAKMPAVQWFLACLTITGIVISRASRLSVPTDRVSSSRACCVLAFRHVNTSLSGTVFFSMCWCIRDAVHFDSRVHAAIKPSHIGGQHGQES
jgi:hypothetical protein